MIKASMIRPSISKIYDSTRRAVDFQASQPTNQPTVSLFNLFYRYF